MIRNRKPCPGAQNCGEDSLQIAIADQSEEACVVNLGSPTNRYRKAQNTRQALAFISATEPVRKTRYPSGYIDDGKRRRRN